MKTLTTQRLLLVLAGACAATASAQSPPTLVPLDIFSVPEGLEVTVWAQSPMLKNPTNIDIDASGRIWVTEGVNYRRHKERDPKGDRVMVLEDTDGDGRADKSTPFVQEPTLVAPLGMAVIGNKVIVSNAPDLIVYTDVDGDRVFNPAVDKREVLLTGFDGRNHDHALHSVTFGPDGRWYFSQGNAGAHFTDRGGKTFRVGSAYNPVPDGGAMPVFGSAPPTYAGAKSDDGHVYVGGFSARMLSNGTGVEILGFNFRNSYEQTCHQLRRHLPQRQRRSASLPDYLPDGVRQPRVLFARRQTILERGSPSRPIHSHRRVAPGRSGRHSIGRCLWRRRTDWHRLQ
jgi:hypothetical protein